LTVPCVSVTWVAWATCTAKYTNAAAAAAAAAAYVTVNEEATIIYDACAAVTAVTASAESATASTACAATHV
jgi:hypothetical protein